MQIRRGEAIGLRGSRRSTPFDWGSVRLALAIPLAGASMHVSGLGSPPVALVTWVLAMPLAVPGARLSGASNRPRGPRREASRRAPRTSDEPRAQPSYLRSRRSSTIVS